MAEDWRVTVKLREEGSAGQLVGALHVHEVEAETRLQLGERIAVSSSGDDVFLYSDTGGAARQAEQVVEQVLSAHHMSGEFKLDRWHHAEQDWEDATVPLPATATEKQAEHERLEQEVTAESKATGLAGYEVRIELDSHHDAHAVAEELEQEGYSHVVRRWKYLLIGTADEDDARALAQRLKDELPAGAVIHVEPGGGTAWQLTPNNPFAAFGGLGG